MTPTKEFPTEDVITAITGFIVSERLIRAAYDVLNWMTGESLFTHQLVRVGREAQAVMVALDPRLAVVTEEAEQVDASNWRQWRQTWIDRLGPTMAVPRMTIAEHERLDPMSELTEMVHPDRVIVVKA